MTGRRGSIWTEGIASRAEARMKAFLKFGVGDAFVWRRRSACRAGRRPRPFRDRRRSPRRGRSRRRRTPECPWRRCGRISCASTEVETGPIWPPASIPSITSASTPERISFLASASAGAKQISLAPLRLDPLDRAARRKPAGEHDMADLVLRADVDQLGQLRVHGDEVDAERPVGARLGLGDLGVEQLGGHRPAGDHAEPAGVGDGGDEVALARSSSSRRP